MCVFVCVFVSNAADMSSDSDPASDDERNVNLAGPDEEELLREKLLKKGDEWRDLPLVSFTDGMPWPSYFQASLNNVKPVTANVGVSRPSPQASPSRLDVSSPKSRRNDMQSPKHGRRTAHSDDDDDDVASTQSTSNGVVTSVLALPRRSSHLPSIQLNVPVSGAVSLGQWAFFQFAVPNVQPRPLVTLNCLLTSEGAITVFVSHRHLPSSVEYDWRSPQVCLWLAMDQGW